MLTTGLPINPERLNNSDRTLILSDLTWEDFEKLTSQEYTSYLVSYFKGVITIVSPSQNHEIISEVIAGLIKAYCRKFSLLYFPMGSTTLKNPPLAGKEPDTSFSFRTKKTIPDLAVEVIYSSGNVEDSLNKYKFLGVKEIWFWQQEKMSFFELVDDKYVEISVSNLLTLSPEFLLSFVNRGLKESPLTIEDDFTKQLL